MKIYSHWRSSASYRLRIAMNLKGVPHELVAINLTPGRSEQLSPEYRRINKQGIVPSLILDDGTVLTQTMAIIEYLDEDFRDPLLLPERPEERARVRALCQIVCADMHPLHTTRVIEHLKHARVQDDDSAKAWIAHWVTPGLRAIEALIGERDTCIGSVVTMADVFLVPEVYAAHRFGVDIDPFPKIRRVDEYCSRLAAFRDAHPAAQPDAT